MSTITLLFLNLSSKNYYELNTIILTFHFKVESTTEVKSHSQLPDDTPFIDFYSDDDNCSSINAALTHADSADRLDTEPGVCNVKPKSRQTEKRSAAWQFYDVVAADKVHQIKSKVDYYDNEGKKSFVFYCSYSLGLLMLTVKKGQNVL